MFSTKRVAGERLFLQVGEVEIEVVVQDVRDRHDRRVRDGQVLLGIDAPQSVKIVREEPK